MRLSETGWVSRLQSREEMRRSSRGDLTKSQVEAMSTQCPMVEDCQMRTRDYLQSPSITISPKQHRRDRPQSTRRITVTGTARLSQRLEVPRKCGDLASEASCSEGLVSGREGDD
ncbi:hypothetical protein IAQ61_008841 [Plenodomus lingam]|uniref:uncharacterized protein n=1 Tax=Leptosphaeria maculans TaxID=5022 RepID=UPI00331A2190|nr:hypothetical protein IAQ61_008841 [Plenodomus lingam]